MTAWQKGFQEAADPAKAIGKYMISEEGRQTAADAGGSAPISESLRASAQEAPDQITVAD